MPSRAHLSNGGVDFIAEVIDGAFVIRYWGASIHGDVEEIQFQRSVAHSDYDEIQNPGFFREHSRGWLGHPAISGHREGRDWSTHFVVSNLDTDQKSFTCTFDDSATRLQSIFRGEIDSHGVITFELKVINLGETFVLDQLWYWLPIPNRADQTLDFVGRWSNERNPQRRDIGIGRWVRESLEGRSGHNFTIGEIALTRETNFANGEAWSIALSWSGNSQYSVEKTYEGMQSLGAREYFMPGEMVLKKNDLYEAPRLIAAYSSEGLDGLAQAHHAYLRSRKSHPTTPRPLTLNLWEAIDFDHGDERVKPIIDAAAEIGVERVVLDDGWFGSRRNDRSGLGDWQVSQDVWPHGLRSISDYVRSKGMQFGLWFEGEMISQDSQLFKSHPDWILQEKGRIPATWRHQQVLNIAHPEAFEYILTSVDSVIKENTVSYIKWDHNRTLIDAGYLEQAATHRQTKAIYRLFAELKKRNPGLEIESCASGGARIDFGIADHVDRFWVSDNNDALERQRIQRWSAQFFAPELLGCHIGPTRGNQTGRTLSLSMRAATALFGHAGIEWDVTEASEVERAGLRSWITYYKSKRSLIHSGEMIRIDYPDDSHYLYGVLSKDRREGLFNFVQLQTIPTSQPAHIQLRGLNPEKRYRVNVVTPAGNPGMMVIQPPQWINSGADLSGDSLMKVGLPAPILRPENALTFEVKEI
ncbi:MAG: alpha-galactosidase [Actinobacteria bacterium]|nr:alpha-galactosidase [Actinomycetota bacterium]